MPTSPAEAYLSAIAPPGDLDLKSCPRGSDHTIKICMGSKNPDDLGRRYFWCSGNNGRCTLKSPKSHTLNDAQRTLLRRKVAEFKQKLKDDKLAVAALDVGAPTARRASRRSSPPAELSDSEVEVIQYRSLLGSKELTVNGTVKIHMFFGPSTRMSHVGSLVNNLYSFRDDIRFCEYSSWPKTEWLMYDIVQKRWIDIPTNSYIEAGAGPLITRYKDSNADLTTFEELDDFIKQAIDAYLISIESPRAPPNVTRRLQCAFPMPSSSQTLPASSSPITSSSQPRKRKRSNF